MPLIMPSDKTICFTFLPMYKYDYNRIPLILGLFIFVSLVAYSIWPFKRKLIYFSHYISDTRHVGFPQQEIL